MSSPKHHVAKVTLEAVKSKKLTIAHFQAVGNFVLSCSEIEMCMQEHIHTNLQIDEELSRLLVGEARFPDMKTYVKAIALHNKMSQPYLEILEDALTKSAYIFSLRSWVAHKPFFRGDGGEFIFHNSATAKKLDNVSIYKCSVDQLMNATGFAQGLAETFLIISIRGVRKSLLKSYDLSTLEACVQKLNLPSDRRNENQRTRK